MNSSKPKFFAYRKEDSTMKILRTVVKVKTCKTLVKSGSSTFCPLACNVQTLNAGIPAPVYT